MLHVCHVLLNDYYLPRTESLLKNSSIGGDFEITFYQQKYARYSW